MSKNIIADESPGGLPLPAPRQALTIEQWVKAGIREALAPFLQTQLEADELLTLHRRKINALSDQLAALRVDVLKLQAGAAPVIEPEPGMKMFPTCGLHMFAGVPGGVCDYVPWLLEGLPNTDALKCGLPASDAVHGHDGQSTQPIAIRPDDDMAGSLK